ncbi:MAG TPA: hypothetical protein VK797_21835 [Tepidisphaeraceae bacterium]|jgi:hypothetical protein|nr:hypothetical protein [Tepidisphaeraceae bacterium]
MIGHVEGRQFAAIAAYPAPPDDSAPQLSLRLMSCSRCGQTNVVTLNNLSWTRDLNGVRKLDIRPLENQLLITSSETEELRQAFKQMTELREAGDGSGAGNRPRDEACQHEYPRQDSNL